MNVIYTLKRRWGKPATLYSIIDTKLDLDTGKKVLTKRSKKIRRVVFLPPKQTRQITKKQAAFDPKNITVLIDKKDVDFPIRLDDYIIYNNWRFVIIEIPEEYDKMYVLKVRAINEIPKEMPSLEDTLTFDQTTMRYILLTRLLEDPLTFNQAVVRELVKTRLSEDSLIFNQVATGCSLRNLSLEDTLVFDQVIVRGLAKKLLSEDSLTFSQAAEGSASTLYNSLLASWKLDETSGIRYDNWGSYHLTDYNSNVGYEAGKLGNAGKWTLELNQYLYVPGFDPGLSDFTICGWLKTSDPIQSGYVWAEADGTQQHYYLSHDAGGRKFNWITYAPDNSPTILSSTTVTTQPNTWYWICIWFDSTLELQGMRINNLSEETIANTVGIHTGDNPNFFLGCRRAESGSFASLIDATQYWARLLTTAEKDEIYNSGTGLEL